MTSGVAIDDPDKIESVCHGNPTDADVAVDDWCGDPAVTWAFRSGGTRVYLCRDHAVEMTRFGDDVFDDGHPQATVCKRCLRYTPPDRASAGDICDDCQG